MEIPLKITHLQLKNFRCFQSLELSFENSTTLISGLNGAGKTSLLEALHYLCYLRSFRTHIPQELVQFGADNFFLKARLQTADEYDVQVGFGNKKRLVKVNNKTVATYKELLEYYRTVTLTEDDLDLIKGGPEVRRFFIDQVIMLTDVEFLNLSKKCKDVVENRNALLKNGRTSRESYNLWTEQLWHYSVLVQEARIAALKNLEQQIALLMHSYFNSSCSIVFTYKPKKFLGKSCELFLDCNPQLYNDEVHFARSLFGAHLDDFAIHFKDVKSRTFASRGQQKLIIVLIKAAQIRLLCQNNRPAILLLDDFMTDFDSETMKILIEIIFKLNIQMIFTAPSPGGLLQKELEARNAHIIKIDNVKHL